MMQVKLGFEIDAYRKLLDGEETRYIVVTHHVTITAN